MAIETPDTYNQCVYSYELRNRSKMNNYADPSRSKHVPNCENYKNQNEDKDDNYFCEKCQPGYSMVKENQNCLKTTGHCKIF